MCEVYPDMKCPWVSLFVELEKIGHTEWMKEISEAARDGK
jgi:hypothetical protein